MKKTWLVFSVLALSFSFYSSPGFANGKSTRTEKKLTSQARYLRFLRYQELMSLPKEKQLQYMRGVQQILIDLAKSQPEFSRNTLPTNENMFLDSLEKIIQKNPHFAALFSQVITEAKANPDLEVVSGQEIKVATAEEIQAAGVNGQPNMFYNEIIDVLHGRSPRCQDVRVRQNGQSSTLSASRAEITFRGVRRYMCVLFLPANQECPQGYRAISTDSADGRVGCALKTTRSNALRRMTPTDTNPSRATGTFATQPVSAPREARATPPPPEAPAPAPTPAPAPAPAAATSADRPAPSGVPAPAAVAGAAATGIDGAAGSPRPSRRGQQPPRTSTPTQAPTTTAPAATGGAPVASAPAETAPPPAQAGGNTDAPAQASGYSDQAEFNAQPRNTTVTTFPPECSRETYACEFGDTAREASREAYEQDLASRNNSCINGANLSRYNVTTRTCARVSNKNYGDRRFTCSGSQTLCNPLVFGVQTNGQALCVRLRTNVTLACSTAARSLGGNDPAANALNFLRENPSMQQAWNEWAQSIERMCQPGTDRNSHRFHCTVCTLIFTHLQKLNALTGYANACGNLLSSLGEGDPMIINGIVDKSLPGVLQRNPQPASAPAQGTD